MTGTALLASVLALYAGAGCCVAAVFVGAGIDRVLPDSPSFTLGARVLLFPGAVLLWPFVLGRWLSATKRR